MLILKKINILWKRILNYLIEIIHFLMIFLFTQISSFQLFLFFSREIL